MTLEQNYRSTQPILDLANEIAAGATRAYPKRLRADREGTARPRLVYCRDQAEQAIEVSDAVLARYEQGVALKEQAVLMRAGHHSDLLELELTRRRIPFVKFGGIRYLEAAHIKDLVCAAPAREQPRRPARLVPRPPAPPRRRPGDRPPRPRRARPRDAAQPRPSSPPAGTPPRRCSRLPLATRLRR